ncbi:hypothetical protein EYV94_27420 [Puteibacter caeruleilacunae]|nr:hypothetical protein EYV94_27420 [Puteibacter caeruleilacunae]
MNVKAITITIITFFALTIGASAQKHRMQKDLWDRYKAEKISYLTENLDLTPEEAMAFWPVYNEFEKKRGEIAMKRRQNEMRFREEADALSDKEISEMLNSYSSAMKEEANLVETYNKKFQKILPPIKVFKLYQSESKFRYHMMRKYRQEQHREKK